MEIIIMAGTVIFLTRMLKILLNINNRWIPLTTLGVSLVIFGAFAYFTDIPFGWNIFSTGIVTGLTAIGLWLGYKITFNK